MFAQDNLDGKAQTASHLIRPVVPALWRGFRLRCPACGRGAMFSAYLKVNDTCPVCGEELHHHRADDAPPYLTILIVGHIVVGSVLAVEVAFAPPMWIQMVAWPILAIALSLLLLPSLKGALVALQWALRMHGFDSASRVAGGPFVGPDPTQRTLGDDRGR